MKAKLIKKKKLTPEEKIEKSRAYQRAYYEAHKEKAREYQRWYSRLKRDSTTSRRGRKRLVAGMPRQQRIDVINCQDLRLLSTPKFASVLTRILRYECQYTGVK